MLSYKNGSRIRVLYLMELKIELGGLRKIIYLRKMDVLSQEQVN